MPHVDIKFEDLSEEKQQEVLDAYKEIDPNIKKEDLKNAIFNILDF